MKHAPLLVLLTLVASSVFGRVPAAEIPPPPPPPPRVVMPGEPPVDEATFRVLDINGDGYVSRAEVRRGTNLERMFDQLDANRDGRLSREELKGLYVVEMPGDAANRR